MDVPMDCKTKVLKKVREYLEGKGTSTDLKDEGMKVEKGVRLSALYKWFEMG
jgi:hypothetical protein